MSASELSEDYVVVCMIYIMIVWGTVTAVAMMFHEAPYGRYSDVWRLPVNDVKINAQLAWLIQESPSFFGPLLVWYCWSDLAWNANYINKLFLVLFLIHYFHRSFIYPFLIRNSNSSVIIVLFAVVFCTFNGYMQSKYLLTAKYPDNWIFSWKCVLGVMLFFFGMFLNIHSDRILQNLRKHKETGYKIPRGGMFEYVSGANYLGEIIEWFGYALASWSLPAFVFAFCTTANLAPRAIHHHRWYCAKFEDYPEERKALIPFIL